MIISAKPNDRRPIHQDRWQKRAEKAEAERDEVLAQVAVLVKALQTVRPHFEGEYHYDHPDCVTIRKALSNLPAAAKELAEKARKWDRICEVIKHLSNN